MKVGKYRTKAWVPLRSGWSKAVQSLCHCAGCWSRKCNCCYWAFCFVTCNTSWFICLLANTSERWWLSCFPVIPVLWLQVLLPCSYLLFHPRRKQWQLKKLRFSFFLSSKVLFFVLCHEALHMGGSQGSRSCCRGPEKGWGYGGTD